MVSIYTFIEQKKQAHTYTHKTTHKWRPLRYWLA